MGIVIRQSFWGVLFAYIGVGIGFINAVILMPKFMSPEEIGLWRTLSSMAAFLTPFVLLGSPGSMVRFLPNASDLEKKKITGLLLLWVGLAYVVIFLLSLIFKEEVVSFYQKNSDEINSRYFYVYMLLLSMVVYMFLESISRSNLDIATPNLIREVFYKSLHLVIIILFGLDFISFETYLYCQLFIYQFLILSILFWVIWKQKSRINFRLDLDKAQIKSILIFSVFATLSGLGVVFFTQIDKLMVARYLEFEDVAIYTTALYITTIISIPTKYIGQISSPIITRYFKENNFIKINNHYKATSINQMLVSAFIFCLIYINITEIFTIMPNGNLYVSGVGIVFIVGITKIIDSSFGLNAAIISLSEKYKINTPIIISAGLINIFLNIILIKYYGIYGAALATLITYLCLNLFRYFYLKVKFKLDIITPKTLMTIVFIACTVLLSYYTNIIFFNPFFSIVIKGAIISLLFLVFILAYKPSPEISSIIKELRKKV